MANFLDFNLIGMVLQLLSWGLIAFLFFSIYRKGEEKPIIWKAIIIVLVGLFSFTFGFTLWDTPVKLPILPLGVWILCWWFKRKGRWQVYRTFAWLGFWANFIFLTATFITIPLHNVFYPKDHVSTYVNNIERSSVSVTHRSATKVLLDKNKLKAEIPNMKRKSFDSMAWHREATLPDGTKKEERFPFYLSDTDPKFGSGLSPLIFVEKDGKGLLISSEGKQYYFRSNESFLKDKGVGE
jgi:hypothetical protein